MTKLRNIVAVALLTSIFSGCGVYSKYQSEAPEQIIDSLYNYIDANNNDTTNIASLGWRQIFTDPYLTALVEQALDNNTDLNVARLNIEQAEIALTTARLAFLPSIGATATANFSRGSSPSYNLAASASWEIDLFGKLRNAKEQNKAALEQSKAYSQSVQTALIATIANSYYSLVMLDEQLAISHLTLKAWQDNIQTMEALRDAGRLNQNSVLQSQASKVALESSIVTIKEQIAELENTISALLMTPAKHIERGVADDLDFPEELAIGVPIQLLSNRPDIKEAEYNLAQAFYVTAQARSSLYPSITLSGSAGFMDSSGSILNPSEFILSAVGSIVQPIFYGASLRAQLNISKLQQEQALLQFHQAIIDAGTEVNTALIQWQSAKDRMVYCEEQCQLLSQALSNSELLMKHGTINYLEVLTAQFSLLQTELSYASNKYDEIQSVINLYRALGGN